MYCLSLLYHLKELFIYVIGNISNLMCGYLNWLVGFECELLMMRWSTSLVTTTDASCCSSLLFLVRVRLGTRITHSYVSRSVELMRHGLFFMNSLQILPRRAELICLRSLECILKANQ